MMNKPLNAYRGLVSLCLLALGSVAVACQPDAPPQAEAALETEEVSLPPDALVDPSLDEKEVRRQSEALSGQLPSQFPADLPTYPGASVTDLGEGERWVEFLVPERPSTVASRYSRLLESAGWELASGALAADGTAISLLGPAPGVTVVLEARGPSTRIVVRY